jgi:hypothetical protein
MSRLVDHRSDLYSLGATFYTLLTGAPPFQSADPLEIVHRHLARAPTPPSVAHPAVPEVLSALVLKLLAKVPEHRYQSAEAVAADLREAQRRWSSTGAIAKFALGSLDLARELAFPPQLYGRARELATLRAVVDRVAAGAAEVVLVSGVAGIGRGLLVVADASAETGPVYRFVHDRVHQAAYSLVADDRRASVHWTIGLRLLERRPTAGAETGWFEIVDQLDRGVTTLDDARRIQLTELNHQAGRKARDAAGVRVGACLPAQGDRAAAR